MVEETVSRGLRARMLRRYWDYLKEKPAADRSTDENARLAKLESYDGLALMIEALTRGKEKKPRAGEQKWLEKWEKTTGSLTSQLTWIKKWSEELVDKNVVEKGEGRGCGREHRSGGSEGRGDPPSPAATSVSRPASPASLHFSESDEPAASERARASPITPEPATQPQQEKVQVTPVVTPVVASIQAQPVQQAHVPPNYQPVQPHVQVQVQVQAQPAQSLPSVPQPQPARHRHVEVQPTLHRQIPAQPPQAQDQTRLVHPGVTAQLPHRTQLPPEFLRFLRAQHEGKKVMTARAVQAESVALTRVLEWVNSPQADGDNPVDEWLRPTGTKD